MYKARDKNIIQQKFKKISKMEIVLFVMQNMITIVGM